LLKHTIEGAMRSLSAAVLLPLAAGHAWMTSPPSRIHSSMQAAGSCRLPNAPDDKTIADGVCRWFNQGCQPGCSECTDTCSNNPCATPMEPTVTDPKLRTWQNIGGFLDYTKYNPWRSPGFAPVFSPCGIAGGGATYHPSNGALAPQGVKKGFDGRDLPELSGVKTEWARGSAPEVAFSIHANHGGGYAYRLCPKSGNTSETCFQEHHLNFVGDQSWVQWRDDLSNRTAFNATRVSQGTNPAGAQWTKNPIPACGDTSGGVGKGGQCTTPPQFEPPLPGLYGYGAASCFDFSGDGNSTCTAEQSQYWVERFSFNIIDKVQIPADLPTGDYLLSFRWDAEQTPQVWSMCSDVVITDQASVLV